MNTTQCSTHRLRLRTQQVDVAVKHGLVVRRCRGVDNHFARAVALGLILLHNLCPQHAAGTELGNLHEVVLRNTHVELDALGSGIHIDTGIHQLLQVFVTPGQRIA